MQSSSIVAERSNELHSTTTGSEWSPISSDKRAAKVARATCDITVSVCVCVCVGMFLFTFSLGEHFNATVSLSFFPFLSVYDDCNVFSISVVKIVFLSFSIGPLTAHLARHWVSFKEGTSKLCVFCVCFL